MARFVVVTLLVVLGLGAGGDGGLRPPVLALEAVRAVDWRPTHAVAAPPRATLRADPDDAAPALGFLAPATPLRAPGERAAAPSSWLRIETPDNREGWLRASGLAPLPETASSAWMPFVPEPAADPIVGTWVGRGDNAGVATFFADGTALLTDGGGRLFHGAWRRIEAAGAIGAFVFRAAGPGTPSETSGPIVAATDTELVLDATVFDRLTPPTLAAGEVDARPEPVAGAAQATPVAVPPVAEDPFPGIAIESLAAGGGHLGAGPDASLSRVTIDPGAAFDYPFPYPVLVAVEAGTLAVHAAASGVTVTSPPRVDERTGEARVVRDGEAVITRQVGETVIRQRQRVLAPGESALIGPGGSASAGAGGLLGLRNAGSETLVLLLVAVPQPGAYGEETRAAGQSRVEVEAAPRRADAGGRRLRPLPCRVDPRAREDVERIVAHAGTPREPIDLRGRRALPAGEPADRATVAAIARLEREFAGCLNASDWPRWLALQTDRSVAEILAPDGVTGAFDDGGVGPGPAATGGPGIAAIAIDDVRLLPDGRVGAVVTWFGRAANERRRGDPRLVAAEPVFRIYERSGDRWLIDDEITGDFGG